MSDTSINFTKLEEMKDIMGEVFIQLIPAYLDQSDEMITEMPDLLGKGDLETLERHAHSLKSSSLNVGAEALSAIARKLEDTTRSNNGDTDALSAMISAITAEYTKVKTELNNYLQQN